MSRRASVVLVSSMISGPLSCGERGDPSADPKPPIASERAATETEPKTKSEPKSETDPEPTQAPEPLTVTSNELAFVIEGQPRRLAVQEPGHATINRLSAPPSMAIIARAAQGSETLIIKLGGIDLARATLPLELRGLPAGGPTVSITYVDPSGARSSGRVDAVDDHLTIDAWDPMQRRLRGRFCFTVSTSGAMRTLTRGSLDVVLQDPFDR